MPDSIRIRAPEPHDPPEFTVEWISVWGGNALWVVLRDGEKVSWHHWRIGAYLKARKLRAAAAGSAGNTEEQA